MGPDTGPIYDRAEDIGKIVKLSSKTIYRMAAEDPSFPSLRVGGSIRFPRDRVIRWFREREQGRAQRQGPRTAAEAR
jgi:predicted DNA-binding transcriptional regulator AlpA